MNGTSCILCDGESFHVVEPAVRDNRFGSPGSWRILACESCGLWQTDPVPTQAELQALYERHYNFGGEGETGSAWARLRALFLSSPLYRLMLRADGDVSFHARRGQGRLLDVGCNEGRGLSIYAANGFRAEGLELNRVAAEAARAKGFVVYDVDVAQLRPSAPYDVVVLSNVLEHAREPRKMLAAIRRILVPGGEVWISLPNHRSWLRGLFGRHWVNWHLPFHIVHFDAATLRRALSESGFTVIEERQVTPALWVALSAIAALFPDTPKMQRVAPLVAGLMGIARGLLFPLLWAGNRNGSGDCLVVKARKEA